MDGLDYVPVAANLTFVTGSTNNDVRCLNITIVDDSALEGNQTFTVKLTTSDPDVIPGINITTINIADDDGTFRTGKNNTL